MIVSTASFRIAPGKNQPALAYLHEVASHLKRLNGVDYRVMLQVAGPIGHALLASNFETVAAWDAARSKGQGDATFQKMAADAGAAGYFLPGSIEISLWQDA
jgi:hypothetical protein